MLDAPQSLPRAALPKKHPTLRPLPHAHPPLHASRRCGKGGNRPTEQQDAINAGDWCPGAHTLVRRCPPVGPYAPPCARTLAFARAATWAIAAPARARDKNTRHRRRKARTRCSATPTKHGVGARPLRRGSGGPPKWRNADHRRSQPTSPHPEARGAKVGGSDAETPADVRGRKLT